MANQTIVINPNRVSPLLNQEGGVIGSAVRYLINAADITIPALSAATDTVTVTLGSTPIRWVATSAFANVTAAFAGPGGFTVQAGTTANPACLLAATNVLAAGIIQPSTGLNTVANIAQSTGTAAATLQLVFTSSVSGGPAALTAGSLAVYVTILNPDYLN